MDDGNLTKCLKHGVTIEEIEGLLSSGNFVQLPDPFPDEPRLRGIGKAPSGRYVFVIFTLRAMAGSWRLRPISARYMHDKEVRHYEQQQQAAGSGLQD